MTLPASTPAHCPPTPGRPIMLADALQAFLAEVEPALQGHVQGLCRSLEDHLGRPAPLLAYTRLTGEAWRQTLPADEHFEARVFLTTFRAFLRDEGWLDAARPVNQMD